MRTYLLNAFSINMLENSTSLKFEKINLREAADMILDSCFEANCIGHETTDALVRGQLASEGCHMIEGKRMSITIDTDKNTSRGKIYIVAQYSGPRLPEGTTVLPQGAKIEYWKVFKPSSHVNEW